MTNKISKVATTNNTTVVNQKTTSNNNKKPISFSDNQNSNDNIDTFSLVNVSYDSNNNISCKTYENDLGDTKWVQYFNNIPISERINARESVNLIKDEDFESFISLNVNAENAAEFITQFGKLDFLHALYKNENLDLEAKNKIYKDVLNYLPSEMQEDLQKEKRQNILDGDFEGKFSQGHVGDCVILGRLIAILSKPQGKQILQNLVEIDKHNNMTITFKGLGKKVVVTNEDLNDEKYRMFSRGNADIKALEIAWHKLTKSLGGVNNPLLNIGFDVALLGVSAQGVPNPEFLNPSPINVAKLLYIKQYKNKFNTPNKAYALAFNALNYLFRFGVELISETYPGQKSSLHPMHQYAVKKADDEYIYVINPCNSEEILKLKWSHANRLSFIINEIDLEDSIKSLTK